MRATDHLPVETLRKLFRLDEETGALFWLPRSPSMFQDSGFTAEHTAAVWNSKWAGKPALNCKNRYGYRTGAALGQRLHSHRVVYALVNGEHPAEFVDHINGVRDDNRPSNLRSVSRQQNARNAALYSSNKSGVPGVMWEESHKAWAAKIHDSGRQRRIGRYKTKEAAIAARRAAEERAGYYCNHGRTASDRRLSSG